MGIYIERLMDMKEQMDELQNSAYRARRARGIRRSDGSHWWCGSGDGSDSNHSIPGRVAARHAFQRLHHPPPGASDLFGWTFALCHTNDPYSTQSVCVRVGSRRADHDWL